MKKTILTLIMVVLIMPMIFTGCQSENVTPTDVVNAYFSSIKKTDTKEAQNLIESTIAGAILSEAENTEKSSDNNKIDESLKTYLSKVDAKVLSEEVDDNKAIVEVEIKAPNYSNLLLEVMSESATETFNGKDINQSDVENSLAEKIKYSESETRSGQINLSKKDNEWKIESDDHIIDVLLGQADEKESVMFSK